MRPSSSSDFTASNCSSRGTFGSIRELPEVEPIDAQVTQALVRLLDEVLRSPERHPAVRAGARQARLGGDAQVAVGMQRLTNEALRDVGAVRVGGVDEVDAELARPLQRADRLRAIGGLAPDAGPGDPHRPEPQAMDGELAAELENPGLGEVGLRRRGLGHAPKIATKIAIELDRVPRRGSFLIFCSVLSFVAERAAF